MKTVNDFAVLFHSFYLENPNRSGYGFLYEKIKPSPPFFTTIARHFIIILLYPFRPVFRRLLIDINNPFYVTLCMDFYLNFKEERIINVVNKLKICDFQLINNNYFYFVFIEINKFQWSYNNHNKNHCW